MRAIGAETVAGPDHVFALGAGGIQIEFALGAKIKARAHRLAASGTLEQHGLPRHEVNHKTDGVGNKNHYKSPECGVHAASFGIAIHVADQQAKRGDQAAAQRHDPNHGRQRYGMSIMPSYDRNEYFQNQKERYGQAISPSG